MPAADKQTLSLIHIYNPLPCYYISAVIYLILNIVVGKGVDTFERRLKRSER